MFLLRARYTYYFIKDYSRLSIAKLNKRAWLITESPTKFQGKVVTHQLPVPNFKAADRRANSIKILIYRRSYLNHGLPN